MRRLVFFVVLMSLAGCSSIVDCALNDAPKWENRELPQGMRFQSYDETIYLERASDFSIQDFQVIGELPNGIHHEFYGEYVRLFGTPTELGNFSFKLKVSVQYVDSEGNSESCSSSAQKGYNLRIN